MIYSNGVLHHIPDAVDIVSILKKYLKVGGIFYVMLYYGSLKHLYGDSPLIGENDRVTFVFEGPYARVYNRKEVEDLFGPDFVIKMELPFNENRFCMWIVEKVR
jgi:hypothetical protein